MSVRNYLMDELESVSDQVESLEKDRQNLRDQFNHAMGELSGAIATTKARQQYLQNKIDDLDQTINETEQVEQVEQVEKEE